MKVSIINQGGKYGLRVTGTRDTGKTTWVESSVDASAFGSDYGGTDVPVYQENDTTWALEPIFDGIDRIEPAHSLFQVSKSPRYGLYFIDSVTDSIGHRKADAPAFVERTFQETYKGQFEGTVEGGFVLEVLYGALAVELEREAYYRVIVDEKHGFLTAEGRWDVYPAYNGLASLDHGLAIGRKGKEYVLMDRWKKYDLLKTRSWRRTRRRALKMGADPRDLEEFESA